jgi:hypothetical protein
VNLLDPRFRYVTSARTAEDGVLARWLAARKNMGESETGNRVATNVNVGAAEGLKPNAPVSQVAHQYANVKQIKAAKGSGK